MSLEASGQVNLLYPCWFKILSIMAVTAQMFNLRLKRRLRFSAYKIQQGFCLDVEPHVAFQIIPSALKGYLT